MNEVHANATDIVAAWYAAWTIADAAERDLALAKVAVPAVQFCDRYSLLDGASDVSAHIAAALCFMPGILLRRTSAVRHCLGTAVAEWSAVTWDGGQRMSGASVFRLGADGRIVAALICHAPRAVPASDSPPGKSENIWHPAAPSRFPG